MVARGPKVGAESEGSEVGMVARSSSCPQLFIFVLIVYSILSWYLAYARVSYDSPAYKVESGALVHLRSGAQIHPPDHPAGADRGGRAWTSRS